MKFLILIGALFTFTSCGSSHSVNLTRSDRRPLIPDWAPEQVHLKCPTTDCPDGVGLLIVKFKSLGEDQMGRCTATLIGADQMVTNNHCVSDQFQPHDAYFFLLKDGVTSYRRLEREVLSLADFKPGLGRDLSFWQLEKKFDGIVPRKFSRAVPKEMHELVAFVANSAPVPSDRPDLWDHFLIERRDCTTRDHASLQFGGVLDQSIGLSLYGCEIRRGNSGSPVFTNEDTSHVQAIINTVWNFSSEQTVAMLYDYQFLKSPPAYLSQLFAMAERVQCLSLPSEPSPASLCHPAPDSLEIFDKPLQEMIHKMYLDGEAGRGISWGYRQANVVIQSPSGPKLGVAFIPYAICLNPPVSDSHSGNRQLAIPTFQMGLDETGQPAFELQDSPELEVTLEPRLSSSPFAAHLKLANGSLPIEFWPSSSYEIEQLVDRSTPLDLCEPGDRFEDEQESIREASVPASLPVIGLPLDARHL